MLFKINAATLKYDCISLNHHLSRLIIMNFPQLRDLSVYFDAFFRIVLSPRIVKVFFLVRGFIFYTCSAISRIRIFCSLIYRIKLKVSGLMIQIFVVTFLYLLIHASAFRSLHWPLGHKLVNLTCWGSFVLIC